MITLELLGQFLNFLDQYDSHSLPVLLIIDLSNWTSKSKVSCTTISQVYDHWNVYGRSLWLEGSPDKRAGSCPQTVIHLGKRAAQCKERKKRSGGKELKKKTSRGFKPTTLTLEGKAPVCIATIALHKDPWLQLLYKYHD